MSGEASEASSGVRLSVEIANFHITRTYNGQGAELIRVVVKGIIDPNLLIMCPDAQQVTLLGEILAHVGPCPIYEFIGPDDLPFEPNQKTAMIITVLMRWANMYAGDWPCYKYGDRLIPLSWLRRGEEKQLVFT